MRPLCGINGVERHYPEELLNLEEILLFVMEKDLPKGELILEVKVDGRTFSEVYENQAQEVDLGAIEKIEITTQAEEDFARDSIGEASTFLDCLERGFGISARLLRNPDQKEKGNDMLARSIEAFQAFKSHMEQVNDLLKPEGMEPGGKIFWERFGQLADRIITSQEEEEAEGVADLIEDELMPFLRTWKETIGKRI